MHQLVSESVTSSKLKWGPKRLGVSQFNFVRNQTNDNLWSNRAIGMSHQSSTHALQALQMQAPSSLQMLWPWEAIIGHETVLVAEAQLCGFSWMIWGNCVCCTDSQWCCISVPISFAELVATKTRHCNDGAKTMEQLHSTPTLQNWELERARQPPQCFALCCHSWSPFLLLSSQTQSGIDPVKQEMLKLCHSPKHFRLQQTNIWKLNRNCCCCSCEHWSSVSGAWWTIDFTFGVGLLTILSADKCHQGAPNRPWECRELLQRTLIPCP